MRDIDDGGPRLLVESLELGSHVYPESGIEVRKRLVQKKELGAGGDCTGDCHTLLLTAGKLVGISVAVFCDSHGLQRLHDGLLDLILLHLLDLQTEGHIVENSHMGPEGIALEHQVQTALGRFLIEGLFGIDDGPVIHGHFSALRLLQSGDNPQCGGFSATRRSQKGHEIPVFDCQIDVFENVVLSVEFIDMLQNDSAHLIPPQPMLLDTSPPSLPAILLPMRMNMMMTIQMASAT